MWRTRVPWPVFQWWVRVSVRSGVTSANFRAACSCRVFLKAGPAGPRVNSASVVPTSDGFMAYEMARHGNPGRIGGHEIQVSMQRGEGGHGQSVHGKPRLEPGAGLKDGAPTFGKRGKLGAGYGASHLMARCPFHFAPNRAQFASHRNPNSHACSPMSAFEPFRRTAESGARGG